MAELGAPTYVQVEVTYGCNLRCGHCYNDARHNVSGGLHTLLSVAREKVGTEQFRRVAERLAEWGIFHATITGGEPLTVLDRTFTVLNGLTKAGIEVDMNSNLGMMTEDTSRRLADGGLVAILTSIASYDPVIHDGKMGMPGSFTRTVQGIEHVKKNAPHICLSSNMVVGADNHDQVYETGRFVAGLGLDTFCISPSTPSRTGCAGQVSNVLSEEQALAALRALARVGQDFGIHTRLLQGLPHCFLNEHPDLQQYMKAGCDAGQSYVTIDPFGNVKPCSQIGDTYGNILTNDFNVIWERMSAYRDGGILPQTCVSCDARHDCLGGCRAQAEREVGSLNSTHPFAKGPLRRIRDPQESNIEDCVGKAYRLNDRVHFRDEGKGWHLVTGFGKSYVMIDAASRALLAEMQERGSLLVTEDMRRDRSFARLARAMITNGVFRETTPTQESLQRLPLLGRSEKSSEAGIVGCESCDSSCDACDCYSVDPGCFTPVSRYETAHTNAQS